MDDSGNKALRDLGIFYCAIYVVSLIAGTLASWAYWNAWRLDDLLPQLANVITVSAGVALLATILKEAGWFMVLAAMKIKEWKEQGRTEGRTEGRMEGRMEGRKEERKRQRQLEDEAYARFGVEVDGVLMLPRTPEVERFLAGETEE